MSTAEQVAERRWPNTQGLQASSPDDYLDAGQRNGFVLGAEWQRKQPVEITDEMVERAAQVWSNAPSPSKRSLNRARAALEAVLGEPND